MNNRKKVILSLDEVELECEKCGKLIEKRGTVELKIEGTKHKTKNYLCFNCSCVGAGAKTPYKD